MLPFFGVFLSDLSQDPGHQSWCNARKWPGRILSPILIVAGLYISSYPEAEPTWMPWSNVMLEWSHYIFPGGCETDRYYTALGLILIALGIHFSNAAKTFLSSKYLLWFVCSLPPARLAPALDLSVDVFRRALTGGHHR
jgi:hypothetical protein